ncbi:MAG TPA: S8 family serine peptidase [Puia sp.]|nr:S8 family serine peptidase [Puia sp.]
MNKIVKKITLVVFMVASTAMTRTFAQKPNLTNDLNTRMDKIVRKYIPFNEDGMQWSNYLLDPVQFNHKIDQARKEAYRRIKSGNAKETTLRHLDIDYYLRGTLAAYNLRYGLDSVGFVELANIIYGRPNKDPKAPTTLDAAIKNARAKMMTDAQKRYIDSLMYSNTNPNNEALFKRSLAYREWIDIYLKRMSLTKYKSDSAFKNVQEGMPFSVIVGVIQNPFIKDFECYQHGALDLKMIKKDSALATQLYRDFLAAVTNTYYRDQMRRVYDNYKLINIPGSPAPDFTYTNVDGRKESLSDLRGKFVYIDVWATWCGPCKAEIPFLMKVEEKYDGKNIQFVSLSVDRQADTAKWRKYVIDNKLTGHQVIADKDFSSDFVEKFNIVSIPRFLLIDPAGNVVEGDAQRPSDLELKRELDQLLGIQARPFALSQYARQTDFSGQWQLNKSKTDFGKLQEYSVSRALNVTKSDVALLVDRTGLNAKLEEKHYSEQFNFNGTSTRTTTNNGHAEVDSIENNPDVDALTLDMGVTMNEPAFSGILNVTETWTLEDGGNTLLVERVIQQGIARVGVKCYYDRQLSLGFAPPKNWQNMDLQRDGLFGISTEKAYAELLKGKTPQTVIVAVIDAGVDTTQEDLKPVLWHNPKLKAFDNGVYGRSFLCSANGNVNVDNDEETAVVRAFEHGDTARLGGDDLAAYHKAKQTLQRLLATHRSAEQRIEKMIDSIFEVRTREVRDFEQRDTAVLSDSNLVKYHAKVADLRLLTAALSWKQLGGKSIDSLYGVFLRRGSAPNPSQARIACSFYFKELLALDCQLNTAYTPFTPGRERYYDCPDVMGPNPMHGTVAAGIIGAVRNNGIGIDGVADDVRIMALRVVPAAGQVTAGNMADAIIYAADHGAKVINLSIGSSEFGSGKKEIDAAVKYAMKKDVLIVQAAGNIHLNLDSAGFYMLRNYRDGGQAGAFILVGGSGPKNDRTLCSDLTFGKKSVDVFAPSEEITSTLPDNKYAAETGTSVGAPVVAGLAALIREYYPNLKAQQVKDIILQTVVKSDYLTGKCVTGGVVNAYNALQLATKL